jgi:hypothetical protein
MLPPHARFDPRPRCFVLALLLLAAVARVSPGQAGPDTAATLYGFLHQTDSGTWQLLLPQPVSYAGHAVNLLAARGDSARWPALEERFLEVVGRVTPEAGNAGPEQATIEVRRVAEIDPPGTVRRTVDLSLGQLAVVTLSIIPNRFGWVLADGQPSGVQPLLVYTIHNHGQAPLDFSLPTNDVLCVRVKGEDDTTWWERSWPAQTRTPGRIVIRLGGVYRKVVPIPTAAATHAGRYSAQVTLCGISQYMAETRFDIR